MWLDLMYRFVEIKYLGPIGSHRLHHGLTWRKPRKDGADIPYLVYIVYILFSPRYSVHR